MVHARNAHNAAGKVNGGFVGGSCRFHKASGLQLAEHFPAYPPLFAASLRFSLGVGGSVRVVLLADLQSLAAAQFIGPLAS